MLQWILEEAVVRQTSDEAIVQRILLVNFAAIHTSSNVSPLGVVNDLLPELLPLVVGLVPTVSQLAFTTLTGALSLAL